MGLIHKSHNAWETAKWIGISYTMSLAAGGLCHKAVYGKMSADYKAAMIILLLTVLILVGVLCTVGVRRWRVGGLSNFEKRILVFSLFFFPVMFAVDWYSNIF